MTNVVFVITCFLIGYLIYIDKQGFMDYIKTHQSIITYNMQCPSCRNFFHFGRKNFGSSTQGIYNIITLITVVILIMFYLGWFGRNWSCIKYRWWYCSCIWFKKCASWRDGGIFLRIKGNNFYFIITLSNFLLTIKFSCCIFIFVYLLFIIVFFKFYSCEFS